MYDRLIKSKKTWYFMLFCTIVVVSIPIFSDDLIFGHDTIFHLQRIESIKEGLLNGDFPVKLYGYTYNNYGYPAGYFYPDLFLYIPAVIGMFPSLGEVVAYHIFLFLITILTAVVSYISFSELFKYILRENKLPHYVYGAVAAMLYTGALYRLVDLYSRSAVGEAIAMAFLPLALIGFYLTLEGKKNAWIGVVIGASGILESHILSSLLLFAAYVLMFLCFFKKFLNIEVLKSVIKASVFIVILNIWFYAPFLSMYGIFDFPIKDMVRTAGSISVLTLEDSLRYRFFIGILPIAIVFIYLLYLIIKKLTSRYFVYLDKIFLFCFLVCVVLIFLASSTIPWKVADNIPFIGEKLGVLQFSYRLSMFTSLFMAITLSIAICAHKRFLITAFVIPFLITTWMISLPRSVENEMTAFGRETNLKISDILYELKNTEASDVTMSWLSLSNNPYVWQYIDYLYIDISEDEYMVYTDMKTLEYWDAVKNRRILKLDPNEITPKDVVTNFSRAGLHLDFTTNTNKPTEIKLPLWFYPHSYGASCDGEELPVFEVYHHRLAVNAPAGEHNIKVFPKLHTPYRNACIISLIGLLAFIAICVRALKQSKRSDKIIV